MERAGTAQSQDALESTASGEDPWDPLMPETEDAQSTDGDSFESAALPNLSSDATNRSSDPNGALTAPESAQQDADSGLTSPTNRPTESGADASDGSPSYPSNDPGPSDDRVKAPVGANNDPMPSDQNPGEDNPGAPSDDLEGANASNEPSASEPTLNAAEGAVLEDLARALGQAGVALQSAGAALSETEGGALDDATEASLTDANIAVLIAEQALAAAEASTENPSPVMTAAISDAARLIILASGALSDAQGNARDPDSSRSGIILGAPAGDDRLGELDAELEASIAIFESEIQGSRDAVASILKGPAAEAARGPGPSLDDISTGMIEPGTSIGDGDDPGDAEALESEQQQGRMIDGSQSNNTSPGANVPEDVPSPQGDDIVAQQLREAASAEQDPELRAKLWEEYKRYKQGL